jgi:serine phosphatase RsbU (regulator of sigma subunit)
MLKTENKQLLLNTRMFSRATEAVLDSLMDVLQRVEVRAGETVFEKGDAGSSMYIVKDGKVRVHDGDIIFNILGPGSVFGEMAVLDENLRSASITAEEDSVLLRLDKQPLHELLATQHDLPMSIISSLCGTLRDRVQDLTDDYLRIKTLEHELEIGRQIQAGFLPESLPAIPGWQIAAYFEAAREVAGDFYDAFYLNRFNRTALIIGDVCDKGVGAALFMTLFRSLLRASANSDQYVDLDEAPFSQGKDQPAADHLLRSVKLTNNYVANTHGHTSMFASLFFGLLNPDTGTLTYVNCGHESPVILNSGKVKSVLDVTGPVVGIFPHANFRVEEIQLEPGDTLFTYTDGVSEAMNPAGEQFGNDRLCALLTVSESDADTLVDRINSGLRDFAANASQSDDITMLAVKWDGQE